MSGTYDFFMYSSPERGEITCVFMLNLLYQRIFCFLLSFSVSVNSKRMNPFWREIFLIPLWIIFVKMCWKMWLMRNKADSLDGIPWHCSLFGLYVWSKIARVCSPFRDKLVMLGGGNLTQEGFPGGKYFSEWLPLYFQHQLWLFRVYGQTSPSGQFPTAVLGR